MSIHDREHLEVSNFRQLYRWLQKNHEKSNGLWVVTYKKATNRPAPTYEDIVRAALCFGWIDSVPGRVSDLQSKLYISPRKSSSAWSQSNKRRVPELIREGLMNPAGLAKIEEARANGNWNKIDGAQNAEVPLDLAKAFDLHRGSRENFEKFPKGVRKQILEWIENAKTAPTRQKRIEETASLAAQNIRANQWRPGNKG